MAVNHDAIREEIRLRMPDGWRMVNWYGYGGNKITVIIEPVEPKTFTFTLLTREIASEDDNSH